jgi:hypothetical protein
MRLSAIAVGFALLWSSALVMTVTAQNEPANLVRNGSFEEDADGDGVPDGWGVAGRRDMEQTLALDSGREGGKAAKLTCTRFVPGSPDSHAMVCQVGVIGVRQGQWYRLSFWAKGENISRSICDVALSNTRPWGPSGIQGAFPVSPSWRHVELVCQATADVPAENSRLQFWFKSTGTLWLDDVVLEPCEMRVEYHPQISADGVRNLIPNSSFECGTAGWGSYAPNLRTWTGNVYRLMGEIDESTAYHGRCSLRMHLDASRAPTYYFDWFDPIEERVLTVVTAHVGWGRLTGEPCTLSCFLKADKADVPALLMLREDNGREHRQRVQVGTEWQRYSLTYKPGGEYVWGGVGIDLQESQLGAATLWVDAVQLEFAEKPSDYTPRAEVESFLEAPASGTVFMQPDAGLAVSLRAFNASGKEETVAGHLTVTDFFDQEVFGMDVEEKVGAGASVQRSFAGLMKGRPGFYRVHWKPTGALLPYPQSVRCALMEPYEHDDSPFGMNHAYGWDFLLRLSKAAGLTWMRDWSVKWHTVEPEQGTWDFSRTDSQIDRVLAEKLNVLVLYPFPSAVWCSEANADVIGEVVGKQAVNQPRYIAAWRAKDDALFRNYIAQSTKHYRGRVKYYEILNEPLYTTYALPARFGYKSEDYIAVLRSAYESIKSQQPDAKVVGGIGTWVDSDWVHQFVQGGGLEWCDIMDIHLYPVTIPPEIYEEDLVKVTQAMQAAGIVKPMWLTEFGCYADDDPYRTPGQIGDAAMARANWPSEAAASEGLVKSSVVFLSHGVQKIFFHAGTCGPINGSDGGGIFFEYGGTPRKMFVALNRLARLLGPAPVPLLPRIATDRVRAYLFRTPGGIVAVAWACTDEAVTVSLPGGITARDLMGNPLAQRSAKLTATPMYFIGPDAEKLRALLEQGR